MDPGQHIELTLKKATSVEEKSHMKNYPVTRSNGKLLYLSTIIRPDIEFALGFQSRNVSNLRPTVGIEGKRILTYLKGTLHTNLVLRPTDNILTTYADCDWAENSDHTSISGNIIQMGGSTIYWKSEKKTYNTIID